jgi:hypothetical protein
MRDGKLNRRTKRQIVGNERRKMKKYGKVRTLLYLWGNSPGTDAGYFFADSREQRVGSWRSFAATGSNKKRKKNKAEILG